MTLHVKDVNVTNPKNVVVQVPGFIARKWGISQGSKLEVHYDDEKCTITIGPKKIQAGS